MIVTLWFFKQFKMRRLTAFWFCEQAEGSIFDEKCIFFKFWNVPLRYQNWRNVDKMLINVIKWSSYECVLSVVVDQQVDDYHDV